MRLMNSPNRRVRCQGPPKPTVRFLYLFYRNDDAEDALAEARTALSMDPANAEAYRSLGLALYAGGHHDAALHAFDEALTREPAARRERDVYFDIELPSVRRETSAARHRLSPRSQPAPRLLGSAQQSWRRPARSGQTGRGHRGISRGQAPEPRESSVRNNLGTRFAIRKTSTARLPSSRISIARTRSGRRHNCLARAYMSKRDYSSAFASCGPPSPPILRSHRASRFWVRLCFLPGRIRKPRSSAPSGALNPQSGLGHHYLAWRW